MTIIKNTRLVAMSQISRVVIQLATLLVLGRILTPADFGVIATASVWTALALQLKDIGTSSAIIQKKNVNELLLVSVFYLNLSISLILCLISFALAYPAEYYFNSPGLGLVLILISFSFPFSAVSAPHQAMMERNTRFAELAKVEIFSVILGFISAVIFALNGGGVYSFVIQSLIMTATSSILIIRLNKINIMQVPRISELKGVFKYAKNLTGFNLINYASRNSDNFLIAKSLGEVALGLYSLAYKIMLFPLQGISFILTRSAYPYLSRLQDNKAEFLLLYLKIISSIVFLSMPLMTFVLVFSNEIVAIFFGEKWKGASVLIMLMAPIGVLQSVTSAASLVFRGMDRTKSLLYIGGGASIIHVIGFLITVRIGLNAVAIGYLITNLISLVLYNYSCAKILEISFFKIIRPMAFPFFASFVAGGSSYYIQYSLKEYGDILGFFVSGFAGFLVYIIIYLLFNKSQFGNFMKLLKSGKNV